MANISAQDFYQSIINPLTEIANGVITSLPGIIGAILVVLVGYIIGAVVARLIRKGLERIDFDKWVVKETHMAKSIGNLQLSYLVALIAKWWIIVLFLPPAAGLIQLVALSNFLLAVAFFVPNIILAVLIALIGLFAANYLADKITKTKAKGAVHVAQLAKWVTILFSFIIALEQVGIQIGLARNAFLIIIGGIVFGFALALGISFGIGGKDEAKRMLKKTLKKL